MTITRRFYVAPGAIRGERATITGPEARHVGQVLRLGPGTEVELFDGSGLVLRARLLEIGKEKATAEIISAETRQEPPPRLVLGIGMLKGAKMDLVVQKATEIGVHAVCPVLTERAVKRQAGPGQLQRWRRIVIEACKQCGRPVAMECPPPQSLAVFLRQAGPGEKIIFHPQQESRTPKTATRRGLVDRVTALVGPEGGFTGHEIDAAVQAGFTVSGLGEWVLRAETAAIAAAAILRFAGNGQGR